MRPPPAARLRSVSFFIIAHAGVVLRRKRLLFLGRLVPFRFTRRPCCHWSAEKATKQEQQQQVQECGEGTTARRAGGEGGRSLFSRGSFLFIKWHLLPPKEDADSVAATSKSTPGNSFLAISAESR
ncbi:hypothetical protein MRX96_042839 [Rhipicephalus microplus]